MDDKIYHNVTIPYNDAKLISDDRNTSVAEATVQLMDPLIQNTGVYDICISKFRIDTQTIPLVIPELMQPQNIKDNIIELNYWVKLISLKKDAKTADDKNDDEYKMRSVRYLYLIGKTFDTSYNLADPKAPYVFSKPVKKKVLDTNSEETGEAYLDNLHPFCYIYEPQEFVDSINNAIVETVQDWGIDTTDLLARAAFFSLEGGKLVFYQHSQIPIKFVFSENLYKYFGLGFNTKKVPSENGFMIANDTATRTPELIKGTDKINYFGNPDNIPNVSNKIEWNISKNHFPVTQTWTCCKSILICSRSLPIKGEYVPTAENDGMLIHENSESCKRLYREFHAGDANPCNLGDVEILAPTEKVLESFYPVPVEGGDIRTGVVYSNESMDVSTKIAITGDSTQIEKFDIAVKWLDIYNNMHNLELKEGTSCDIRIAFVKKSVKQDLVLNGFTRVLDALKYSPAPPTAPPKKYARFFTNI